MKDSIQRETHAQNNGYLLVWIIISVAVVLRLNLLLKTERVETVLLRRKLRNFIEVTNCDS